MGADVDTLNPKKLRDIGPVSKSSDNPKRIVPLVVVHGQRDHDKRRRGVDRWACSVETRVPQIRVYTFSFDSARLMSKGSQRLSDLSRLLLLDAVGLLTSTANTIHNDAGSIGHIIFVGFDLATYIVWDMMTIALSEQRQLGLATAAVFAFQIPDHDGRNWQPQASPKLKKLQDTSETLQLDFDGIEQRFHRVTEQRGAQHSKNVCLLPSFWNYRRDRFDANVSTTRPAEVIAHTVNHDMNNTSNVTSPLLDAPIDREEDARLVVVIQWGQNPSPVRALTIPQEVRRHSHFQRMTSQSQQRQRWSLSDKLLNRKPTERLKEHPGMTKPFETAVPDMMYASPSNLSSRSLEASNQQEEGSDRVGSLYRQSNKSASRSEKDPRRSKSPLQGSVFFPDGSPPGTGTAIDSIDPEQKSAQQGDVPSFEGIEETDFATAVATVTVNDETKGAPETVRAPGSAEEVPKLSGLLNSQITNDSKPWVRLANSLYENGNLRLADKIFDYLKAQSAALQQQNLAACCTVEDLASCRTVVISVQVKYYRGEFRDSAEAFERLWEIVRDKRNPDQELEALQDEIVRYLGLSKFREGQHDEAIKILEGMKSPSDQTTSALALVHAHAGNLKEAVRLTNLIVSRRGKIPLTIGQDPEITEHSTGISMQIRIKEHKARVQMQLLQLSCATTLSVAGKHREARDLFYVSFAQAEESLGSGHVLLLSEYAIVGAWLLAIESRTRQAEQTVQKTIRQMCDSQELGPQHPCTLQAMHTLVWTLRIQGRYSDAEHTARQLVKELKLNPNLGPRHPETLKARTSLCEIYLACGKWDDAESQQRDVLDVCKEAKYSLTSPAMLKAKTTMSYILMTRGKTREASALIVHSLIAQLEQLVGDTSPRTDTNDFHMSSMTEQSFLRMVASGNVVFHGTSIRICAEPGSSPTSAWYVVEPYLSLLDSIHCFALCKQKQEPRDLGVAKRLLNLVYMARKQQLGEHNSATMSVLADRAVNSRLEGHAQVSLEDLEKVKEYRMSVLGADSPETLWARHQYACTLFALGRLSQAAREHIDVMDARRFYLGDGHADTLESQISLAQTYKACSRPQEALDLLEETLPKLEQRYGHRGEDGHAHPQLVRAWVIRAALFLDLARIGEAELDQQKVVDCYRSRFDESHMRTLGARNDLARMYEAQGHQEEAKKEYRLLKSEVDRSTTLYLSVVSNLAAVHFIDEEFLEAEELQAEIIHLVTDEPDGAVQASEGQMMAYYFNLALTKKALARTEKTTSIAHDLLRKAIVSARDVYGTDSPQVQQLQQIRAEWQQAQ